MGKGTRDAAARTLIENAFPKLQNARWHLTSPQDPEYNGIAWAAGVTDQRWWPSLPDFFWPPGVTQADTVASFEQAFATLGYAACSDGAPEAAMEKVAIYAGANGEPKHAARQLPNGKWTSKLGPEQDIEHHLHGLEGQLYGSPVRFMKRPRAKSP